MGTYNESEKDKLRVLLSAYACEPERGSEPGVGWNMAKVLSSKVKLSVVTRANNKSTIERCGEDWVKDVNWVYYDPPKYLTWWKKGERGVQLFYILWQLGLYIRCRLNREKNNYDLIHHVTFGKYWVPSLLPLLGLPYFFGSVGGAEYTPYAMKSFVTKKTLYSERVKKFAAFFLTKNPLSKVLYRKTSLAYAATDQTKIKLLDLGVRKVKMLPQSGISTSDIQHYGQLRKKYDGNQSNDCFVVCTAARLIPWKGVDIAIKAFLRALPMLPPRSLMKVAGEGPEMERLVNLVNKAGAEDKVLFLGRLPTLDDVYRLMIDSHILLHAATSEAFGQVCAESLALGTPVVCWDWAGPGLIVESECGCAVAPNGNDPIRDFADAIITLSDNIKVESHELEAVCVERVKKFFLWEEIGMAVHEDYKNYFSLIGSSYKN